jgi:hypothetical protein
VVNGKASYAEQFEGMYVMMRGVAGAAFLALFFYGGWLSVGITAVDVIRPLPAAVFVMLGLAGAFVLADFVWTAPPKPDAPKRWIRTNWGGVALGVLCTAALVAGGYAALQWRLATSSRTVLIAITIGVAFLASRSYRSYHEARCID